MPGQYGWYKNNADGRSHPAGTKLPNGFGLYDMHGNLYEGCGDFYEEQWYEKSSPNDPIGPVTGVRRVIRGGSWFSDASYCRSAFRSNYSPSYRNFSNGFRVVRVFDVPAPTTSATPKPSATGTKKQTSEPPFHAGCCRRNEQPGHLYAVP